MKTKKLKQLLAAAKKMAMKSNDVQALLRIADIIVAYKIHVKK